MSQNENDHLFEGTDERNDDDDYNYYDCEDLLNDAFENDYDFYEADYDGSSATSRTPLT